MKCVLLSIALASQGCLAGTLAATACDHNQTRVMAAEHWSNYRGEDNPLLGEHPSTTKVNLYFAAVQGVSVVADQVLPTRLRALYHVLVTGAEVQVSVRNAFRGVAPGFCGVHFGPAQ